MITGWLTAITADRSQGDNCIAEALVSEASSLFPSTALLKMVRYCSSTMCYYWDMSVK